MSEYVLALLKCKGIGSKKLYNYFLKYNFREDQIKENIKEIVNDNDFLYFKLLLEESRNEILKNKEKKIEIITLFDTNYPKKLLLISDPILYLYYYGNIELLNKKSIAIIGSREITEEDKNITFELANKFSKEGITVVSGLALGTDTEAHKGTLNNSGSTIAVLPSGINIITPTSNRELAKNIINNSGLIVSEYTCDTPASKFTFVKRDRIQAALADAVLVVKANETSGTMNAVRVAQESEKYVTQLSTNINTLIKNQYKINSDEDFNDLINIINNKVYNIVQPEHHEQESLF